MADKSTIKALSDSNLASGQSGGILAVGHREVNDAILSGEATVGTGATILFDSPFGRIYNSAAPSNAANIVLDPTGALVGAVSAFYNDGSVEPTVTPQPEPAAGTWANDEVNVYWFIWDGTNFTQNIQARSLLTLTPPTFTLARGSAPFTLDYSSVVHDSNATASVMEISSDQVAWYQVTAQEFTFGDITGTIDKIDGVGLQAIQYYVRLTDSASGYKSETTEHSAVANAIPTLTALTLGAPTVAIGEVTVPFANPNSGNEDQNQLYYKLSTEPTTWTTGVVAVTGATTFPAQTGLTDGLEYDFKAVAEGDGINYADSVDSNEVSAIPSVLFFDTFTGTTIDTTKWNINTDADITISQNNELIFTDATTGVVGTAITNNLETVGKFSIDTSTTSIYIAITIGGTGINTKKGRVLRMVDDITTPTNEFQLTRSATVDGESRFIIRDNGSVSSANDATVLNGSWKITIVSGTVSFYKWNGSVWGSVVYSGSLTNDTLVLLLGSFGSDLVTGETVTFDDLYISIADFSTITP